MPVWERAWGEDGRKPDAARGLRRREFDVGRQAQHLEGQGVLGCFVICAPHPEGVVTGRLVRGVV